MRQIITAEWGSFNEGERMKGDVGEGKREFFCRSL